MSFIKREIIHLKKKKGIITKKDVKFDVHIKRQWKKANQLSYPIQKSFFFFFLEKWSFQTFNNNNKNKNNNTILVENGGETKRRKMGGEERAIGKEKKNISGKISNK